MYTVRQVSISGVDSERKIDDNWDAPQYVQLLSTVKHLIRRTHISGFKHVCETLEKLRSVEP